MTTTILGTAHGAYRLDDGKVEYLGLEREHISAVYAQRTSSGDVRILAGSYESGLFLSDDQGTSWNEVGGGFSALCVRWLGPDPLNQGYVLAGTEPGRIFRSPDAGETWKELKGIRKIEGHDRWFLPYSPRSGAVRNIYNPPGSDRYLASVEVGGLLESIDNGDTWTCRNIGVDSDIHFITGHPRDGNTLYAALGYAGLDDTPNPKGEGHRGGLSKSIDGGSTWDKLFGDYTRGVIVPESDPGVVIAGPSPDVGHNGRIEVSRDAGESWEDASSGIETPMADMVEVFVESPTGSIWAICSGGRLLTASPDELNWSQVPGVPEDLNVKSVTFVN